jgi:hypothetical protein
MVTTTRLYPLGDYYINGSLDEVTGKSSYYFNGSNNGISIGTGANNTSLDLATGAPDWTVETWVNITTNAIQEVILAKDDNGSTSVAASYAISSIGNGGGIQFIIGDPVNGFTNSLSLISRGTNSINSTTWSHLAMVRSGSNLLCYVNGILANSSPIAFTMTNGSNPLSLGRLNGGGLYLGGNLYGTRIVKGRALYTSNFTPSTALFNIANTSLLTALSPDFIDYSNNNILTLQQNVPPTVNSLVPNTTFSSTVYSNSTSSSMYVANTFDEISISNTYQYSTYIDGSTTLIKAAGSQSVGSLPYTLECFFYSTSTASWSGTYIFGNQSTGVTALVGSFTNSTCFQISRVGYNSRYFRFLETPFQINTWYHLAICRNANSDATAWLNGVRTTSTLNTSAGASLGPYFNETNSYGGSPNEIGAYNSTLFFNGMLSNVRISYGIDSVYNVYSNTIQVPILPLTVAPVGNTTLLACQLNSFTVDSIGNALTSTGTLLANTFIPTNTQYASQRINNTGNIQVVGQFDEVSLQNGSLVFNGTNQHLTVPANAGFAFGTGDFTVEFYMKSSQNGAGDIIAVNAAVSGTDFNWSISRDTSGTFGWYVRDAVSSPQSMSASQAGTLLYNGSWHHVAAVRASGVTTLFVNGTIAATPFADTSNYTTGGVNGLTIAYGLAFGVHVACSLNNIRIIKGLALYTSNFTPPTYMSGKSNTQLHIITSNLNPLLDISPNNLSITNINGATYSTDTPF